MSIPPLPFTRPPAQLPGLLPRAALRRLWAAIVTPSTSESWGRQAPGALERTLNLPFGQMPGAQAIGFNIGDGLVHTWDLAKATGRDRTLDPEVCAAVLERVQQILTPEARSHSTAFGPEQPCPPGA